MHNMVEEIGKKLSSSLSTVHWLRSWGVQPFTLNITFCTTSSSEMQGA